MHTFVTGAIGSGKTCFSARLGRLARCDVISLDAIYFDLAASEHRKVRDLPQRLALLRQQLSVPRIFEGWHFGDWLVPLYQHLSRVIIIDTPLAIREQRIRDRFDRRKAGIEPNPFPLADESHLQNLLTWTKLFAVDATRTEIRNHCPPGCEFYLDDGFGSYFEQHLQTNG